MTKTLARDAAVIWCDRGWLGCKEPYPANDGCATTFTQKDGKVCIIVTLGKAQHADGRTRVEVAGLLCHEATHIWQEVRKVMGEKDPSIEFEAYSMQAIFQGLYQAWLDTAAPDEMLARGAKREAA